MKRSSIIDVLVTALLLANAVTASAQASSCPPCDAAWAALPARIALAPRFPRQGDFVRLDIFDPAHSAPTGVVRVLRDSPNAGFIEQMEISFDNHGFALGPSPRLSIGWYVVEYFDQSTSPAAGDIPKVSMRFVVSRNGPVNIVEYFNSALGHYFITGDPGEIDKLDDGTIAGWQRTGQSFRAIPPNEIPSFAQPVCRFYGLPSAGIDSHFFSDSADECAAVQSKWPDKWILETDAAFATVGNLFPFECDRPLFRLYDNRPDANHRYTTSTAIRDQMIAQGWILEVAPYDGPYDDPYSMCVLE